MKQTTSTAATTPIIKLGDTCRVLPCHPPLSDLPVLLLVGHDSIHFLGKKHSD